jgi:hypothetical protein
MVNYLPHIGIDKSRRLCKKKIKKRFPKLSIRMPGTNKILFALMKIRPNGFAKMKLRGAKLQTL